MSAKLSPVAAFSPRIDSIMSKFKRNKIQDRNIYKRMLKASEINHGEPIHRGDQDSLMVQSLEASDLKQSSTATAFQDLS